MKPNITVATRYPQTILMRFILKRSYREAIIWGLVFGALIAANAYGFVVAYPSAIERAQIVSQLGNNIGVQALLGKAYDIGSIGGFTAWRGLGQIVIIGSVWAMFISTRWFRGEEESGRRELLLTGHTTRLRSSLNVTGALAIFLVIIYLFMAIFTVVVGQYQGIDFSIGGSLFFALVCTMVLAVFMSVGALTSQLASTRRGALMYAGVLYGIFYVLRMIADTNTSLSWVRWTTPLGWISEVRAFTGSHLLPLFLLGVFTLAISGAAIFLVGKRDIGASILPDRDTAKAHARLLNNTWGLSLRLSRPSIIGWSIGMAGLSFMLGVMAHTGGDILKNASNTVDKALGQIISDNAELAFLGAVFLFASLLVMFVAASQTSATREQEAQGYVDNLLVRSVSRFNWLVSRICVTVVAIVTVSMTASIMAYLGIHSQHGSLDIGKALLAGANFIAPSLLIVGFGSFMHGFAPRFVSISVYSIIGWSFLVEIIGSVLKANHWLMDTSLLHHVTPVPAVDPNWGSAIAMACIGISLASAGVLGFAHRDLKLE